MGVGAHSSQIVQSLDQKSDTRTDTGSRWYIYRSDEKCYHLISRSKCSHQRRHDFRYDDGHAIYHRATNAPISQFIGFVQATQDAQISLERLNEIQEKPDEEPLDTMLIREIPDNADIEFRNVVFQYEGPHSEKVLDGIDLKIPHDKVTAIVGESGSGKRHYSK